MQVLIREEIFVTELTEGSLAEEVFEIGDKLISISNGKLKREVRRLFTPIDFILSLSAGDEITFTVERGGEVIELKIVLTEKAFSKVA